MRFETKQFLNQKASTGNEVTIVKETNHNLYSINEQSSKCYKLYIGNFDHNSSELDSLIFNLEKSGPNDFLEISIHSYGGLVYELQRLENIIKNIFPQRTRTILNPMGYSAGGFLFLMGDERLCFENSQIMLHNASGGFFGKFSDVKTNYEFEMNHLENYFQKVISPFLNKKEVTEFLNGKEYWFDTLEMCKRKICTHVIVNGDVIEAKEYIELMEPTPKPEKPVKTVKKVEKSKVEKSKSKKNKSEEDLISNIEELIETNEIKKVPKKKKTK